MAAGKKGKGKAGKGKGKGKKGGKKGASKNVSIAAPLPLPMPEPPAPKKNPMAGLCDYREDEGMQDVFCKPHQYPDVLKKAQQMSIVATDKSTYESLCKVLKAGLNCSDRVLMLTPWGNFVVYRYFEKEQDRFYLYDGCTCNANVFRHLDLSTGTAGFLDFESLNKMLIYIMNARYKNAKVSTFYKDSLEHICCRRTDTVDMCCNKF